jgi:uncharacterized protein YgfB (UPF0149 family)
MQGQLRESREEINVRKEAQEGLEQDLAQSTHELCDAQAYIERAQESFQQHLDEVCVCVRVCVCVCVHHHCHHHYCHHHHHHHHHL